MVTEDAEPATKMHRPKPDRFATKAQPKRETLQPYDADSACPKCEATGAGTQWQPGTVQISFAFGGPGLIRTNGPDEPGWMQRTCINCDYRWAEAPVDAS